MAGRPRLIGPMVLTVSLTCAGVVVNGSPNDDVDLERDLARIREATRAFHDIEVARKAGYPSSVPEHCMESPAGGMGFHYLNPALLDDRLELERPEILVYAPSARGRLKLAGVEYIVPYSAWTATEPPRMLGQPLKRADDLQIWYLHVWIWEENPQGLFADWNPAVTCGGH